MPNQESSKEAVPARGGGRGRGRGRGRGGAAGGRGGAAGGGAAGGAAGGDSANRAAAQKFIRVARNTLANKPNPENARFYVRKKYAMNVSSLRTSIERIKIASIAGDRAIRKELKELHSDLNKEFGMLHEEIKQLQDGHSVLSKDVADVKGTIEQLQDTVAEHGERLTALEAAAASKEELAALKKEVADMKAARGALEKDVADMKAAQAGGKPIKISEDRKFGSF